MKENPLWPLDRTFYMATGRLQMTVLDVWVEILAISSVSNVVITIEWNFSAIYKDCHLPSKSKIFSLTKKV